MSKDVEQSKMYSEDDSLKRGMKSRHLAMIAIGGTIGSTLFLGLGSILSAAGPFASILAFCVGGFIMLLALVSLAELAVAMPISGSFQAYAARFISPMAGYFTGWLYWLNWVTAAAASLTAAAIIMHNWLPVVDEWIWCAIFLIILGGLNLLSAKAFGEAEFWFAGIKVVAIIIFIILGAGLIMGLGGGHVKVIGFSAFTKDGLFPTGIAAAFFTMVMVITSFQGAELVGIAAGESENPEKNVPQAVKAVGVRILLFYVLAIIVVACLLPWQEAGVDESPFSKVFNFVGIPYAGDIMSFVVITSCLSSVNSAIYASSRFLWSMSREGLGPNFLQKTNSRGIPLYGVLLTIAGSCIVFLVKIVAAETVFVWIMSASGLIGCVIWMIIAKCHINFRKEYLRMGNKISDLKFKAPCFPMCAWLGIILNAGVILSMYFDPANVVTFFAGLGCLAFIVLTYYLFMKKKFEARNKALNK